MWPVPIFNVLLGEVGLKAPEIVGNGPMSTIRLEDCAMEIAVPID